jgi:hypothetical protein
MKLFFFAYMLAAFILLAGDNENLDSLALKDSKLKPIKPLIGEQDDRPGFTREMIQVLWREDDPIYLMIIKPKGVVKPPVILYLYGFPSETSQFMDDELCKLLVKKGFAAVGFVSALTGHRYHDRPMREWFVSELKESLVSSVHDVEMIINYLETRSDLDAKRLGMFGEGSGGTIAMLAAIADTRIQALDLLDPWGDWPEWLAHSTLIPEDERADLLKPEFLKQIEPLDPITRFPQLTSVPIRYEYLTPPGVTPQVVRDRLRSAAPPQALIVPFDIGLAEFRATKGTAFLDWIKSQPVFRPSRQ